MTGVEVILLVSSVAVFGYLCIAMFKPECSRPSGSSPAVWVAHASGICR
jgi:hypothetical protein